jgi:hypothetical protein
MNAVSQHAQAASEAQGQATSDPPQAKAQSQRIPDDAHASLLPVSPLSDLSDLSDSPAASRPGAASAHRVKAKPTGTGENSLLLGLGLCFVIIIFFSSS